MTSITKLKSLSLKRLNNAEYGAFMDSFAQIIEQGNHESLLESKGFYYDLYQSQFSKKAEES